MSKPKHIGCVPFALRSADEVIAGSTVEKCAICDAQIWVAPSSRKIAAEIGAMPVCFTHLFDDEVVRIEPLNTEQMAEIRAWLKGGLA